MGAATGSLRGRFHGRSQPLRAPGEKPVRISSVLLQYPRGLLWKQYLVPAIEGFFENCGRTQPREILQCRFAPPHSENSFDSSIRPPQNARFGASRRPRLTPPGGPSGRKEPTLEPIAAAAFSKRIRYIPWEGGPPNCEAPSSPAKDPA
jgi:hypothetical protein